MFIQNKMCREFPDFSQWNGWIAVYPFSLMMLYIIFLNTLLICRMSGQDLRHFEGTKLNEGIYACVHKFGGEAICNSGVIDMGDYSLVIDPFMTPDAAQELLGWMKSAGLPPVRFVVNTHYHNDHVLGNQEIILDHHQLPEPHRKPGQADVTGQPCVF